MHRYVIAALLLALISLPVAAQKTIHVFVALCDNKNQGIVPVPETIGNGQDPDNNLYWGAGYGVKTFLNKHSGQWILLKEWNPEQPDILDRLLFKHKTQDVYLLADAYDGARIKNCTEDVLLASNRQNPLYIIHEGQSLQFGGKSDLIAYIGHNGLMDFKVQIDYQKPPTKPVDLILLGCFTKSYFASELRKSGANPLLWSTHLMAPEAYTLNAAINGWILNESGLAIEERAAQAYHKYQQCGIRGARNLFTSGF